MKILKILSGIVSFLLALVSLLIFGLIALAWFAQYSNKSPAAPLTSISVLIGPVTVIGGQVYAVASFFIILAIAFIIGGVYAFRSPKTDA